MVIGKKTIVIFSLLIIVIISAAFFKGYSLNKKVEKTYYTRINRPPPKNIVIMKFSHRYSEYSPQHRALLEKFIPLVQEGTNGDFVVEVYANSQLGDDEICIEGLEYGTIEMGLVSMTQIKSEAIPVVDRLLHTSDGEEILMLLLDDDLLTTFTTRISEYGLRCLGITFNGFKQLFFLNRSIMESDLVDKDYLLEDMKNLKNTFSTNKKIPDINILHSHQKGFLLEETMLGACNHSYNMFLTSVLMTNHEPDCDMLIVSEKFWDALHEKEKDLLISAVRVTIKYLEELVEKYEQKVIEDFRKNQILIINP